MKLEHAVSDTPGILASQAPLVFNAALPSLTDSQPYLYLGVYDKHGSQVSLQLLIYKI